MFKLIREETSAEDAVQQRHQWPVRYTALYSADDTPAKLFVMHQSGNDAIYADALSCIASAIQMTDLPEDAPEVGSPFYRVHQVTKLCRSAKAAEEFVEKVEAAVQDLADNLDSAATLSVSEVVGISPAGQPAPDLTPTIVSLAPEDDAVQVAVDSNFVITFHEQVLEGSGNVTIKNLTDATQVVIPIGDTQVTIVDEVVTINPTADLLEGKNYAIQIAAGALEDFTGNAHPGILDDTTWNFRSYSPTQDVDTNGVANAQAFGTAVLT